MRKRAEQRRELPHGKPAQNSDDCGNENLSLAIRTFSKKAEANL
jgi:hypothetical protein